MLPPRLDPLAHVLDLGGLEALAARLGRCADEAAAAAGALRAAQPGGDWAGAGADAAREALRADAAALRRCAEALEGTSALVRAHADEVRTRLAALLRARELLP